MINQTFANRFFPGQDPIGQHLKFGAASDRQPWITIVGVVADMHRRGLERRAVCEGFGPGINSSMNVIVRSSTPPDRLLRAVRSTVHDLDPSAPVYGATTLEAKLADYAADRRLQAQMLGAFFLLTLILAAVGVYGVTQYIVSRRRREMAIRIAIGAERARVVRLVLFRGMRQTGAGIALGLAATLAMTRVLAALLYGVSAVDPITLISACALLACVAIAACWLPARSAARTDPRLLIKE